MYGLLQLALYEEELDNAVSNVTIGQLERLFKGASSRIG